MPPDLILSIRTRVYLDYKGWRFYAPFHCMRCGDRVDPVQWAFSRSCGGCDVSESHTARLSIFDRRLFAGDHDLIDPADPSFLEPDRFLPPEDAERFPVLDPPRLRPSIWDLLGLKPTEVK